MWKINEALSSLSLVSKLEVLDSKLEILDSKLEVLDLRLDTRSFRVSRIEDRVETLEYRGTVNLLLPGTVPCINYMESSVTEISLAEDKEEQFQNTSNNIVK